MKLVSDKNNVYVFRSYLLIFQLFGLYMIGISARLYFHDHDMTDTLICLLFAFACFYFGTVYCKMTFDLNLGLVRCSHFKFFRLRKFEFSINDIEKITACVIRTQHHGAKVYHTSLSIYTSSADNNTTTFHLGTNKDRLHESVELMNSPLDQYRQKQRQGTQS